jgi:serine/threonine protein phosphatase PrpC
MHKDGTVAQVTQDEGEGNRITNALGMPMNEGDFIVKQWGDIGIRDGDKFMLCSDGITGDYGDQLMGNDEIGQIMSKAKSPSEAAMRLTAAARKHDDRTVIVFEP